MHKKIILAGAVVVLPLCLASAALAQSAIVVPPSTTPSDSGAYSLKGAALPPASAKPQQAASIYELKSTNISGSASASQVMLTTPIDPAAAAYKTESGIYLYPSAFVGAGYNNNLTSVATNTVGSNFVNLSPQLVAEMKHKGDRYTALASLNSVRYGSSSGDNYNNSEFNVAGDHYFTSRASAGWSVGRVDGSDPRGSTERANSEAPDQWHMNNINARFNYGAMEAPGRFEFDVGLQDKTYENNRAATATADLTLNSLAGRFLYRLGTRTHALAEIRNANARYASALSSDSNTERRYYAGVTWEATAATTGIVKVGRMTKDFDLAGKAGFGGGSWEATVRWLPRTYSAIDLKTARTTADASGAGNYELKTSNDVIWNHKWTQSLSSRVSLGNLKTDFVGVGRTDTATNYALTIDYSVLRWLKIGIDIAGTDNTSSAATEAFKRNVTMLTLNATL